MRGDGPDERTNSKCVVCTGDAYYAWDASGGVCCMDGECPLNGEALTVEVWDALWAERERAWNYACKVSAHHDQLWHEKMKSDGRAMKAEKQAKNLRDTIKAVLDTAEDKSLGFFWLEQALKGDFDRE